MVVVVLLLLLRTMLVPMLALIVQYQLCRNRPVEFIVHDVEIFSHLESCAVPVW